LQLSFCEEPVDKPTQSSTKPAHAVAPDRATRRAEPRKPVPGTGDVTKQRRYDLELTEAMDRLNARCGTDIQGTIDWATFKGADWEDYSIASFCESAVNELGTICKEPVGREAVSGGVKVYTCLYGGPGKRNMSVKQGLLQLMLDLSAANYDSYVHEFLIGHL
jgi:hypothetical protein